MQAEFAAAPSHAVVAGRMLQSLFHVPWQAVLLRWGALSCWNSGTQVQKRIHLQCPAALCLVLYTPHKQNHCLLHRATLCPAEIKEYIHQGTGEGLPGCSEHTARSQLEQHSLAGGTGWNTNTGKSAIRRKWNRGCKAERGLQGQRARNLSDYKGGKTP